MLGPEQIILIAIWIDMLPSDGWEAAQNAASIFEPFPFVAQFHDPHRAVGKAVAASIGAVGQTAWDMYLFYNSDTKWKGNAPKPLDWVHQLGHDEWAHPNKFYWGEQLPKALRVKMQSMLEKRRSA